MERQLAEYNLTGADLDMVVWRADATHHTIVRSGYMMMEGIWIWRVRWSAR
jgi:hypothetical protein